MSKRMSYEDYMEARDARRFKADAKRADIEDRRWNEADRMVGTLIREGREVFYISPVGGRYREGTRSDLIAFLIRNKYVR